MANIVEYRQRVDPNLPSGAEFPRVRPLEISDGGAAQEMGRLSQTMGRMGQVLKENQEEEGRAYAAATLSQARLDWAQRMTDAQNNVEPNAPEFTSKVLKEYDAYMESAVGAAPTPSAKKFLSQRLTDLRVDVGTHAVSFEAQARIDFRADQFTLGIDNTRKLMMTDPSQYQTALAEQLAVIDSSALPPIKKSEMRQKAITGVSEAAVWSQVQKSPTGFLQSIGFMGVDPVNGKLRKTSGDLMGKTGNTAFDALPFDKRVQMFEGAVRTKAQIDHDADIATDKERKKLADDAMKEAWGRHADGKLSRSYIEHIRPLLTDNEYHSLLTAKKGDGAGAKTDPGTFRRLQELLYSDPTEAEKFAFQAHKNGLLSNEHLSSGLTKSRELSRSEGPKSEYERSRSYIVGSLDPGPLVQDPVGRSRMAEALDTFDRWHGAEKRADKDVMERGREIINQYKFINFSETAMALPMPRSGNIRRNMNDPAGMVQDIANAATAAKRKLDAGRISQADYDSEMSILNRWRKLASAGAKQ